MILFFGMQTLPLAYGVLYLFHSFRVGRKGQGIAIASLLLAFCAANAILLWEFFSVP